MGAYSADETFDIGQTIESMNRLLGIPADVYITGHQLGIVEGGFKGLAEAYVDVIEQREGRLLDFLASPRTLEEIVNRWIIYGRERKPRYFFELGEREMIRKHLERLIAERQVVKRDTRYSRL